MRLSDEVLDTLALRNMTTQEVADAVGITYIDAKEVLTALEGSGDVLKHAQQWVSLKPIITS